MGVQTFALPISFSSFFFLFTFFYIFFLFSFLCFILSFFPTLRASLLRSEENQGKQHANQEPDGTREPAPDVRGDDTRIDGERPNVRRQRVSEVVGVQVHGELGVAVALTDMV
eukprot:TRINITY_DN105704_c0_g1_i1.p2 TRINITY_DN105704_c0_g1~~TRINITY_DN105704_c0_g1_i1.p2  ORF type:complete len:113 (-),score=9.97 TRINITY_DN105704_c0_g1_i1:20-358(-)